MTALWRGSRTTQFRIVTGLILFVYVLLHFINIGLFAISPDAAQAFQTMRNWVIRSNLGTAVVYGALIGHAVLALGKVALSSRLRLSWIDVTQVGFGIIIPLMLASHVVFTRGSNLQFETIDTVAYLSGLIWGTGDAWQQAILLLITWVHGCIGLHMWLRILPFWQRNIPVIMAIAVLIPAFALSGYATAGRYAHAKLTADEDTQLDFLDDTNWPGPSEFETLITQSNWLYLGVVALLGLAILTYVVRQMMRPKKRLKITYVDGPTVTCASGPTLLEISQEAGVPHTSLCGGRGRCTTCRVIIEKGAEHLAQPLDPERRALRAVGAPDNARLACQMRPTAPATVFRMFQPDGRVKRGHATQGKEAQLAILFLDMRGFTARTTGQLPYDVVFLLNRFFDAIVPPINNAGGTVDKYLGDGLLAVFETDGPQSSAQAGLRAAKDVGEALEIFNTRLTSEGEAPVRIGLSLHLGNLVLGEIGAAGQAPRTLIGDTVNTASRLEAETKALGVEGLFSKPLLDAAGVPTANLDFTTLNLRGVADPLPALAIPKLSELSAAGAATPQE